MKWFWSLDESEGLLVSCVAMWVCMYGDASWCSICSGNGVEWDWMV